MRAAHFILVICLLGSVDAEAQVREGGSEYEIEADSLVARRSGDTESYELVRARLNQGDTRLQADRMVDRGGGRYFFYRNVQIVERGDTLTANEVLYNRYTKTGRATGNVRLSDGEVTVTAPSGTYDTATKMARFDSGVTMVDSASVLTSLGGSYWSDEKRAEFAGEVRLVGDEADVVADSLTYHRETRVSLARGNVVIVRADSSETTVLMGNRAFNDEENGIGRVDGRVLAARLRTDSTGATTDTLFIAAERLRSIETDSLQQMSAVDSVRIWRRDFSAVADSVMNERQDSTRQETRLYGNPRAWFRRAQVNGDTLVVVGRGAGIDTLFVRGNAFVAQEDTAVGRLQQMSGRTVLGLFQADSLRSLRVAPNARTVYFLQGDAESGGGAVKTSADRIVFKLDGDKVTDVRIYQGVEGTYYPADILPADLKLDGLDWRPASRPAADPFIERLDKALGRFGPVDTSRPDAPSDPVPVPVSPRPSTEPNRPRAESFSITAAGYTLIVASSTWREDVERAANAVKSIGYPVSILEYDTDGLTRYRLGLGRFDSIVEALNVFESLKDRLPRDTWVRRIRP